MLYTISNYNSFSKQFVKDCIDLSTQSYINHTLQIDFSNCSKMLTSNSRLLSTRTDELSAYYVDMFNNSIQHVHLESNTSSQPIDLSSLFTDEFVSTTFYLGISGYATLIVAIIGIIQNTAGICLLSNRSRRRNMFNMLLSTTLLFDTSFLVFHTLGCIQAYFVSLPANYIKSCYIFTNSGERFSLISSILMVLALGHSRYHAVKRPFKQRLLLISWKRRRKQFLKYIILSIWCVQPTTAV